MIAIGNNNISGVFMGSTPVSKMYLGSVLVYGGSEPSVPNKTVRLWLTEQLEGKDYYDIYYANGVVSGVIDYVPPYMVVRVEFGDGLTRIEDNAFAGFELIKALEFPETMTSLGKGCFMNCSSLKFVYLSTSTVLDGWSDETPRNRVFYGCNELTELYINNTVTNAYEWVWNIDNQGSIHISNAEKLFDKPTSITLVTNDGESKLHEFFVIYKDNGDREFFHAENGIIKSGWQPTLMTKDDIERIEIENGVTEIGRYAFNDIPNLVFLSPINAERIGDYAFKGCSRLLGFNVSGKLELWNEVKYIGISAFEGCSSIEKVVIGDTFSPLAKLQSIGAYAFYGCSKLNEITCSATTAPSVNSSTFFNVASGGTLNYPDGSDYSSWLSTSEHYLGYYGWNNIVPLGEYEVRLTMSNGTTSSVTYSNGSIPNGTFINSTFRKDKNIVGVEIGKRITSIGNYTFNECSNITSVTIGNSVRSIGTSAFSGCTSLTSVTIGNSVTSIGTYAFQNCTSLTNITIPDSVTSIENKSFYNIGMDVLYSENGKFLCHVSTATTSFDIAEGTEVIVGSAFQNCSKLTSITIPDSVTTISTSTFNSCSNLTSITIPDSVTIIGASAFSGCTSLTTVTIPDSVTSIGNQAFQNCSSLTSVTIGNSVTSIGNSAFSGCTSLYSITCKATTAPTISSGTFKIGHYFGFLYHPIGSDYSSWLSTSEYYLGYYSWYDRNVSEGGDGL